MDTDLLLSPVTYVGAIIGLIALLLLLTRFLANVGATEIAIKERRYFGSRMPPGRVVATEGEVGIQADVLKPGLHIIKWPFERVVKKASLIEIGADEMGVIEAIDGEPLPPGRIFAPDRAQNAHNNFQDPIAFIKRGGVKGIQMRTLPPGLWPIHPYLFRVSIAKSIMIPQGKIGIVTATDGAALNPRDYVAAPVQGHNNFQNGHEFIQRGGQRGPQKDLLLPGTYYIDPLMFKVIAEKAGEVRPGEVAVIVSNVGKGQTEEISRAMATKVQEKLEREEREQLAIAAAHLDKLDGEQGDDLLQLEEELKLKDPADSRLD